MVINNNVPNIVRRVTHFMHSQLHITKFDLIALLSVLMRPSMMGNLGGTSITLRFTQTSHQK